jgi:hypothetical protein
MKVPVIWHAQEDSRGYYNCTAMVNDLFDSHGCGPHYPARNKMPDVEGAIVVVHGGRELGGLDRLNRDIEPLKWVLLIFLGDEESQFPAEQVEHPNKICWVQEPLPGKHDFADRFILDGYTPHTRKCLIELPDALERDLDWCFAGQMTHERRWACRNALQNIDWGGVIVESKGYCQGVSLSEYYRLLRRAKIVPCPSGPFSPDSARVCEALECGAIPILDDLSPTRKEPGFWKMVLGDHPLPVVTDWSTLPRVIEELKSHWNERVLECELWWACYKKDFMTWLEKDVQCLTTRT